MNTAQFKQWCESYSSFALTNKLQKPLIMGVLNVTPDSFSDGGLYFQPENALERALQMIGEGADLIDIGGESTRPGAQAISCDEELSRVIPVIQQIRKRSDICISIDTKKAQVMHEAIHAGASIINDISGFQSDRSLAMAVELDVPLCLMHMQGAPQDMQNNPQYTQDVVDEINLFFQQRIETCLAAGIKRKNLILDPGFGFGKTPQHNMRIINQMTKFQQHKLPIMIGVSRKSTLGVILNSSVEKRLAGGLAIAVYSALHGVAMIRTHDIAETNQALTMVQAINEASENNKTRAI